MNDEQDDRKGIRFMINAIFEAISSLELRVCALEADDMSNTGEES